MYFALCDTQANSISQLLVVGHFIAADKCRISCSAVLFRHFKGLTHPAMTHTFWEVLCIIDN